MIGNRAGRRKAKRCKHQTVREKNFADGTTLQLCADCGAEATRRRVIRPYACPMCNQPIGQLDGVFVHTNTGSTSCFSDGGS